MIGPTRQCAAHVVCLEAKNNFAALSTALQGSGIGFLLAQVASSPCSPEFLRIEGNGAMAAVDAESGIQKSGSTG